MITEEDPVTDAHAGQAGRSRFAIIAKGVGKAYYPSSSPASALIGALTGRSARTAPFWALHPLDLQVERGEVLGLVGHNGAGKSTLLQMLSGTLSPSTGQLQVNGRVAALLELGAGFNPEFTGRENVLLNGPLLGLSRQELAARLQGIIDFSGIGEFIDQPVKTYSSGMFVRLAFSLATSVDPDILVIDEALSVGDGEFARKSFDRILALRDAGTTILFCSHSMYQIESLCTRALWLDHGRARQSGRPAAVTTAYQEHLDAMSAPAGGAGASEPVVTSPGHARIKTLLLACDGKQGGKLNAVSGQSTVEVTVGFESDPALDTPNAAVTINAADGRILASSATFVDGLTLQRNEVGQGTARIVFDSFPLLKGNYTLSAYLFCERGLHIYSAAEKFAELRVEQDHLEQGVVSLPHRWHSASGLAARAQPPDKPAAGGLAPLVLPSGWTDYWSTRWAVPEDVPALQKLFKQAFGAEISAPHWNWKYRAAPSFGTVVERDGEISAFYGGTPRLMFLRGSPVPTIQMGDVMVRPDERGALTRKGPMFRSAAAFIDNMAVFLPQVQFAFGFPHARALKLGMALGLYEPAEDISELVWTALAPERSWRTRTRDVRHMSGGAQSTSLDALWARMQREWPELLLPERAAARWQYRYADHPEQKYQILLVKQRWSGRPLAGAVVRVHPGHLEWLDFVGDFDGIAVAARAVRMRAAELGLPQVRGWFSSALVEPFSATGASVEPTEIRIPVNLWGRSQSQAHFPAKLWLMAGDTDFR